MRGETSEQFAQIRANRVKDRQEVSEKVRAVKGEIRQEIGKSTGQLTIPLNAEANSRNEILVSQIAEMRYRISKVESTPRRRGDFKYRN